MTQSNVFASGGLGWVVGTLTRLKIKTVSCSKVTGGSYIWNCRQFSNHWIARFLMLLNVLTSACIVAAALFSFIGRANGSKTHKKNIEWLPFNAKLMPMLLSAIPSFEKRNRCSINVYQMENSKLVYVYLSENGKGRHKIDLLRLMDNQNSHYCLIKNFSNLFFISYLGPEWSTTGDQIGAFAETASNRQSKRFSRNSLIFAKVTHHLRC